MMTPQPSASLSSDPRPAPGGSICVAIFDELSRFCGLREVQGDPSQWPAARRDSRGPGSQCQRSLTLLPDSKTEEAGEDDVAAGLERDVTVGGMAEGDGDGGVQGRDGDYFKIRRTRTKTRGLVGLSRRRTTSSTAPGSVVTDCLR